MPTAHRPPLDNSNPMQTMILLEVRHIAPNLQNWHGVPLAASLNTPENMGNMGFLTTISDNWDNWEDKDLGQLATCFQVDCALIRGRCI